MQLEGFIKTCLIFVKTSRFNSIQLAISSHLKPHHLLISIPHLISPERCLKSLYFQTHPTTHTSADDPENRDAICLPLQRIAKECLPLLTLSIKPLITEAMPCFFLRPSSLLGFLSHHFLFSQRSCPTKNLLTFCLIASVILSFLAISALFTNMFLLLLNYKIKCPSALLLTYLFSTLKLLPYSLNRVYVCMFSAPAYFVLIPIQEFPDAPRCLHKLHRPNFRTNT